MDAHITKRTAVLLLLDIVATYAAYWLASLLTAVAVSYTHLDVYKRQVQVAVTEDGYEVLSW